ncbi:TPA: hypothetical protein ACPEW4_001822 [Citrobacter braakii]|nr:hypothetical protein [Citrobacter freundii]
MAGIALRAIRGDSIYFYAPERVVVALSLCGSALMFVGWLGGVWCV